MTSDIAHALNCSWRSLHEQQEVVLAGKYRKRAMMKPFDGLTVSQLAQELQARDVSTTGLLKPEMAAKLQGILLGFLRVPSLLMYNPTQ